MKVLLVGSGAREHALARAIAKSSSLDELHAAPGNPGIARLGVCHPVRAEDGDGLLALATTIGVDLAVIGPEAPLVAGVADELRHAGVSVFGPSAEAARIEGSKLFAKDVMAAAGVPMPALLDRARVPCVVKADGLAAGKGVFICHTEEELDAGLRAAQALGGDVVVEELLEGREVSLFALCDGRRAALVGAACDFKRVYDADQGPNTGGMGAYAPVGWLEDPAALVEAIHQPVLLELARRRSPFVGCLFAGLIVTDSGPRVLEFNARFGDPETQALVPGLEGDLLDALAAVAAGDVAASAISAGADAAVSVVLTAPDYPARSDYSGVAIEGIEDAEAAGALVFHGGTAVHDGRLVTSGGRILSVTGLAPTVKGAREQAYAAVERVTFRGMHFRTDIASAPDA